MRPTRREARLTRALARSSPANRDAPVGTLFCWTLVLASSATGCTKHATSAECSELLDRYVELLVREQDPKANDREISTKKGLTKEKAEHDPAFVNCPNEVTARQLRCAMSAPNVDELEKCLE